MNYNYLVYFQKLAYYEHYRKAAEALHITQPSLSNAIHQLEEELQVPLFEKAGRGVRLTKQGKRYLEYVNHAIHELQVGSDALQYEQIHADAFLSLGIVMAAAYELFPRWITGFQKKTGRKVFYSCVNDTSDALASELKAGSLDLIVSSRVDDSGIVFTPLIDQHLMLITPKFHRLAGRKSVDIRELDGEAFVAHSRNTALHDILADIYRRNHIRVKIISEADEDRAVIGMVRAGLGCGVTTQSSEIFGTDFSAIPITGSGFNGQLCIGRKINTPLSSTAEDFYEYLKEECSHALPLSGAGS